MTLLELIQHHKHALAACRDVTVAGRIYEECRQAEAALMSLTDLAAAVAARLCRSQVPESWQPRLSTRR